MAAATIYSTTTFSFFIFFFSHITAQTCTQVSHCGQQNPLIKFPFSLKSQTQHQRCGHPDFQIISCNTTRNQTLMSLPSSRQFLVKTIDYKTRTVLINDPENCMPKWLIRNFTVDRPFRVEYDQQSFSFVNCTTDVARNMSRGFLSRISCLSGDGYEVFAVRTGEAAAAAPCKVVSTVVVPAQERRGDGLGLFEDVKVVWNDVSLDCKDCEDQGGTCFDDGSYVECLFLPPPAPIPPSPPADSTPNEINYTPLAGVIVPVLFITIVFISLSCQRLLMSDTNMTPQQNLNTELSTSVATQQVVAPTSIAPNSNVSLKGLSRTTIQSFPKTKLSESEKLPDPSENTCSICLSEYQLGETIRTIPNCKHFFHVSCIDQWLLKNSSCPLCRDSSTIVPPDSIVHLPYSSMMHSP